MKDLYPKSEPPRKQIDRLALQTFCPSFLNHDLRYIGATTTVYQQSQRSDFKAYGRQRGANEPGRWVSAERSSSATAEQPRRPTARRSGSGASSPTLNPPLATPTPRYPTTTAALVLALARHRRRLYARLGAPRLLLMLVNAPAYFRRCMACFTSLRSRHRRRLVRLSPSNL